MAQGSKNAYPEYSIPERRVDLGVHLLSLVCACLGLVVLAQLAREHSTLFLAASLIYGSALIFSFGASTLYHHPPNPAQRAMFRRFDYAAIFLMIAATYTPLAVFIQMPLAWIVLALVWCVALWGAAKKLFFWRKPGRSSTLLYLALGWFSVVLIWPMFQTMPHVSVYLFITAGLTYSVGVIFYKWENLKFSNAIWHGFVFAAALLNFIAIYIAGQAAA